MWPKHGSKLTDRVMGNTKSTLRGLSERYIREYNQEEAVKELISKQNKKGTVGDWLKPR